MSYTDELDSGELLFLLKTWPSTADLLSMDRNFVERVAVLADRVSADVGPVSPAYVHLISVKEISEKLLGSSGLSDGAVLVLQKSYVRERMQRLADCIEKGLRHE